MSITLFWVTYIYCLLITGLYAFRLLQIKEYRFDRLKEFWSYRSNRKEYLTTFLFLKFFVLFAFLWISEQQFLYAPILAALFALEAFWHTWRIFKRGIIRPRLTLKMLLFLFLYVVSIGMLIIFLLVPIPLGQLFVLSAVVFNLFAELFPFLLSIVFFPFTSILKRSLLRLAEKKLAKMNDIKVIGITGSYGKSSTKEYLATLLSEKFVVFKTPKNTNTEIGIAQLILKKIPAKATVFLVEMGAYRIGEIKKICDMVHPDLGVLTGINDQHLALFGSQRAIIQAKFELLESLPPSGRAFVNADNSFIAKNISMMKIPITRISCHNKDVDVHAENIVVHADSLSFNVFFKRGESVPMTVSLAGKAAVHNVLLAIAIAYELGMTPKEIQGAVAKIKAQEGTMSLHRMKNGAIIVDDSYNANADGVLAGIDYLVSHPAKHKVIFLSQVIELGKHAGPRHHDFLVRTMDAVDTIVMTQQDYNSAYKRIAEGIDFFPMKKLLIVDSVKKDLHVLTQELSKDAIILCEGRSSASFCTELKKH